MIEKISQIGVELSNCSYSCLGVVRDQNSGIVPRYLVYEPGKSNGRFGIIVVGENPYSQTEKERTFFQRIWQTGAKITYQDITRYWTDNLRDYGRYYRPIRNFIYQSCGQINILWTDTVKCQKADENGWDVNTVRRCATSYLKRELISLPPDWPALAIGNHAFKLLPYICTDRLIIGIYHPGQKANKFRSTYFDSDQNLLAKYVLKIRELIESGDKSAYFLDDKLC